MKRAYNKSFRKNILLWWIAIISIGVCGALYFALGQQADMDVTLRQERMIFPLIVGICLIAGTANRWFK